MKKNKKLIMAIASFAIAGASLVGGTFAWFVMANTSRTTMHGTMVDVEDMQVGLRSAVSPTTVTNPSTSNPYTLTELGLEQDTDDAEVYWSTEPTGFRDITLDVVAEANGYANAFTPVTTGSYAKGDDIVLKDGLTDQAPNTYAINPVANDTHYSYTLIFRTVAENSIYINGSTTIIEGNGDAAHSLRIGVNSTETKTVIDPFLQGTDAGSTDVGGRMDIDGDGVWDYVDGADADYEIVYGEFAEYDSTAADGHNGVTYLPDVETADNYPLDGSNGNFLGGESMHGVHVVDTTALTPLTQENETVGNYLRGANSLAVADANGIAEVTITIWSEGWDSDCTNDIKLGTFSVTLGFVSTESIA